MTVGEPRRRMRDGRRTEASGERRGGDGCARGDYNVFCLYYRSISFYQLIENLYRHTPALGVPASAAATPSQSARVRYTARVLSLLTSANTQHSLAPLALDHVPIIPLSTRIASRVPLSCLSCLFSLVTPPPHPPPRSSRMRMGYTSGRHHNRIYSGTRPTAGVVHVGRRRGSPSPLIRP